MKTTRKNNYFKGIFIAACLLVAGAQTVSAQGVAISSSSSTPNASAMLDVQASNKGVLLPQVALTGNTDATTISSPATSLLIYNTATAGSGATAVTPGFYYQSSTPATPLWVPFGGGSSKFTVSFGMFRYQIIDASPSPVCGSNSNVESNIDYGNPATSAPNATKYSTEAIFTAQSNCTFNGLNGWISEPFAAGAVVTVSLYRFRQVSGSTPPMGTLVGSTIVTCTSSSNTYSYSIPAPGTPFTAQQGDMFLLFMSQPGSAANFNVNGSLEFINN